MIEGINAGVVAVVPENAQRVVAGLLDAGHADGGFEEGKGAGGGRGVIALLRLRAVSAGAGGARALVAQIGVGVLAAMAVFPVDLQAFGFGDGEMFRFGVLGMGGRGGHCVRSTSRMPEMRRRAETTRWRCFISRTSMVMSIRAP